MNTKTKRRQWVALFVASAVCGVAVPAPAFAGAVRAGFSASRLPRTDDSSSSRVDLGFTVDYLGRSFSSLYVNNNGNITFDAQLETHTAVDLTGTARQIIAPFFADVDTRFSGSVVTYGPGTVGGRLAFGVNWVDVGCYSSLPGHPGKNSIQLVLIDRSDTGAGNFDFEFNYDQVQWESGGASGGNGNCMGGLPPRAGFSNATGRPDTSYELPGSGVVGAFLDDGPSQTALIHNSLRNDVPGRYVFSGRSGAIVVCSDRDGDGVCDEKDNCPDEPNAGQEDSDGDGSGNVCDACPRSAENDADGDGLCGDVDLCPGTLLPEQGVPSQHLGVNRWADVDGDRVFETKSPPGGGRGPQRSFTLEQTRGCSCTQIIDELGLGEGHRKFGCSGGVMEEWVALAATTDKGMSAQGCSVQGGGGVGTGMLVLLGLLAAMRRRRSRG